MKKLFGEVNNLDMFVHPKFNQKFKFMNDKQSVELAKKVLNQLIQSGFQNVVVIESGTSPLITIMKKLKEYKTAKINLFQIKIPRDLKFNLYEWFQIYLSCEELEEIIEYKEKRMKRETVLKDLCQKIDLEEIVGKEKFTIYDSIKDNREYHNLYAVEFRKVLKGTNLYEILNHPFLVFDEYINAGTIIRNFNIIVRLFVEQPNFQLSAYCMFLDHPEDYEKIAFTLYHNGTELECYQNGAYPFENRIDLIGYYYFITKDHFKKIYLEELEKEANQFAQNIDIIAYYQYVKNLIIENHLLEKLKVSLQEEQVQQYVTQEDVIRYIFKYIDKKIYGENLYADFLDQVFELYAPAWSPMPTIFHLDYWNGFEKIKQEIDEVCKRIEEEYKKYRFNIIKCALKNLKDHREKWNISLNQEMEEENENN